VNEHRDRNLPPGGCPNRARWTAILGIGLTTALLPLGSRADSFSKAYYDSGTDQLVVSVTYLGTNANHTFTLQWGQCQEVSGGQPPELAVDVLDDQWQDEALRPYEKTVRFSLAGIPCRRAEVTLRIAPRFTYTLLIPK
jgi:hypothetical protein